jgi:hypothetical protein
MTKKEVEESALGPRSANMAKADNSSAIIKYSEIGGMGNI